MEFTGVSVEDGVFVYLTCPDVEVRLAYDSSPVLFLRDIDDETLEMAVLENDSES